jgi:hypothetical protein
MAKIGINLIPGEEKASFEVIELARKVKFYASILVITFLVTLFACFVVFFRVNSHLNNLLQKISLTEAKIKSYQSPETDLVIIKDRLTQAGKILKKQERKIEVLNKIKAVTPPEVIFETIESGEKGGLLITVSSSNLLALHQFIKDISNPEFAKDFRFAEISSVSRSEKGIYSFIFECAF